MRKITQLAMNAIENGDNFKRDNTEVQKSFACMELLLYGHLIATKYNDGDVSLAYADGTHKPRENACKPLVLW